MDRFAATEQRFVERAPRRRELLATLEKGEWLSADSPERVDRRLARLAVAGNDPGPQILERMFGDDNLSDISFFELGLWVARSVGRVVRKTSTGAATAIGTGFMVSPRLLMTNNHVLRNVPDSAAAAIEFNYQVGTHGRLLPIVSFDLEPTAFFMTDQPLDYTLVAVKDGGEPHKLQQVGWNRLIPEEGKIVVGEYVNVIGHPDGQPKKLAVRDSRLLDVLENHLHYDADTAGGSSGSPVFNDQWEVVALHHSGAARRDTEGRILSKDGTPWSRELGEERVDWVGNEGIRISKLMAHIQQSDAGADDDQRRLRSEMLELQPPPVAPSSFHLA